MATHSYLIEHQDEIRGAIHAVKEVREALLQEVKVECTGHCYPANTDLYNDLAFDIAVLQIAVAACLKELNSEAKP